MAKAPYLHGYSSPEQQRLIDQADYWRDDLILRGSRYEAGESLLEIGCGVGAVLGVLGQAYPGLELHGVDWEPKQLRAAERHLASLGLKARLKQADALALPFGLERFDQAWMMWFLEHVRDPAAALAEAWRVLKPGGRLTCIEIDYRTLIVEPWSPDLQAMLNAYSQGIDASGRSDAGTRLKPWLKDAGFASVDVQGFAFDHHGADLPRHVGYLLGFIESTIPAVLGLPGVAPESRLRRGVEQFRALARSPRGRVRFTVHKAWARKAEGA